MLRDDGATSSMKDSLNGYRIMLFNSIGEMIMANQRNGNNNMNFHLVEANPHHVHPSLPQNVSITRGIPQNKI